MSALPPKADMTRTSRHVHFVPTADIPMMAGTSRKHWELMGTNRLVRLPKNLLAGECLVHRHGTAFWVVQCAESSWARNRGSGCSWAVK